MAEYSTARTARRGPMPKAGGSAQMQPAVSCVPHMKRAIAGGLRCAIALEPKKVSAKKHVLHEKHVPASSSGGEAIDEEAEVAEQRVPRAVARARARRLVVRAAGDHDEAAAHGQEDAGDARGRYLLRAEQRGRNHRDDGLRRLPERRGYGARQLHADQVERVARVEEEQHEEEAHAVLGEERDDARLSRKLATRSDHVRIGRGACKAVPLAQQRKRVAREQQRRRHPGAQRAEQQRVHRVRVEANGGDDGRRAE
eukprot:2466025-Prymnesium_polylepis.1